MAAPETRTNGNGNGNGNGSKPVAPPRVLLTQQSFSGTPRGQDGIITPDEYVWELMDVRQRIETFEEMGNDSAIASAIEARRQEVYAANWQLTSEDDSERGAEILDFVTAEIEPWIEDILRWLCDGRLQYGFACPEPVFAFKDMPDGSRKIGLLKIAHIRQVTVEIHITPNGDLDYVMQRVYDGTSTQTERTIDAAKLLFTTYAREGADYYGRPPIRKVFKDWSFKKQLEGINLHHFERFGSGVVKWTEPEGGLPPAERDRLQQFGIALRAGAENVISVPSGTGMEIQTASGDLAGAELGWVEHYESRIAKVFLTQGTDLGTTDTGSRAVGQTFEEQLAGAVQADAEAIAAVIGEKLIKRLVDINFGEQDSYPSYAPSKRMKAGAQLFTNLTAASTAGVFHARPEDEVFVRDVLEMPEVSLEDLQAEQEERDQIAQKQADAKAAATAAAKSPGAASNDSQSGRPPASTNLTTDRATLLRMLASDLARAEGGPEPAINGQTSHRTVEFSEWEQRILQPDLLSRQLDLETTRTTAETTDVLRRIDEYLATQAEKAVALGAASLAAHAPKVSNRLRQELIDALTAATERVRDLGINAVRREIRLQLGPAGVGPQRAPTSFPALFRRALAFLQQSSPDDPKELQLAAEVKRAAEEEIDRREQSTRGAISIALSQSAGMATAVLASVLSTALRTALDNLSTARTEDNVQRVVNTSFGIGRSEAARAINDSAANGGGGRSGLSDPETGKPIELVQKIYSAVMDFGTCDECAKWDGAVFPIDYPEDLTGVQAPNPRCAGGARCRCAWIYVTDKEVPANVGPAKGPA